MGDNLNLDAIEMEEIKNIKSYMQKFYNIWTKFGLNNDKKIERGKTVWKHVINLLQDILEEEISYYEEIENHIKKLTKKINELSHSLSLVPVEEKNVSLVKKEENLQLELDKLTKLKRKRLKAYHDLRSVESVYCSLLGKKAYKISSSTGIPSENDLLQIEQHIQVLREERDKRHDKFSHVKKQLSTILEATEITPETSFEEEILSEKENIPLTDETFKALDEAVCRATKKKTELETKKKDLFEKLTYLWNRLRVPESKKVEFLSQHVGCKLSTLSSIEKEIEIYETIKKENIKMFIDTLRKELKQIWDKCCVSEEERNCFGLHFTDEMTDEVLDAHEGEIRKWKEHYEKAKSIFLKIDKRNELWEKLLSFENKTTDPNRFKNRRGNLLQEEKERKKLQRELPYLEDDLFSEIDSYESKYGQSFLYYGKDYRSFVSHQWQIRQRQKENVKVERQRPCNSAEIENETESRTPTKKIMVRTPDIQTKGNAKVCTPSSKESEKNVKTYENKTEKRPFICDSCVDSNKTPQVKRIFTSCNSCSKNEHIEFLEHECCKNLHNLSNSSYSNFADELNSPANYNCQSSMLSAKKNQTAKTDKINQEKDLKNVPKSKKSIEKTTASFVPVRAKLGLPFIM